jgi:hypothetical protein
VNVAIYNMYFAALGGGERRTAALAAHLAERHDVSLFVHSPLDISIVKSVFGIDLSRVRFLWNYPDELIAQTRRLLENSALREAMAARAVADSRRFGVQEFLGRMDAVIARLAGRPG